MRVWYSFVFFFFQAEDGIRDLYVTGVQTCALPICRAPSGRDREFVRPCRPRQDDGDVRSRRLLAMRLCDRQGAIRRREGEGRSEERRVGKECRSRWWP